MPRRTGERSPGGAAQPSPALLTLEEPPRRRPARPAQDAWSAQSVPGTYSHHSFTPLPGAGVHTDGYSGSTDVPPGPCVEAGVPAGGWSKEVGTGRREERGSGVRLSGGLGAPAAPSVSWLPGPCEASSLAPRHTPATMFCPTQQKPAGPTGHSGTSEARSRGK